MKRFKDYVHERLDAAGIPTHPDGEHSKNGCRIGDRLDIVLGRLAEQECQLEVVREAVKDMRIAHDMSHAEMCDEQHWRDEFERISSQTLREMEGI